MAETTYFPRHLILTGAAIFGMLLALGVHILGQRFNLDLGGLWTSDSGRLIPATAAIAWWLIAAVGLVGGYITAALLRSAISGHVPRRMRHALIAGGLLLLAAAGQAASSPSAIPTISGLLAGILALILGALMAFCGAYFALERA